MCPISPSVLPWNLGTCDWKPLHVTLETNSGNSFLLIAVSSKLQYFIIHGVLSVLQSYVAHDCLIECMAHGRCARCMHGSRQVRSLHAWPTAGALVAWMSHGRGRSLEFTIADGTVIVCNSAARIACWCRVNEIRCMRWPALETTCSPAWGRQILAFQKSTAQNYAWAYGARGCAGDAYVESKNSKHVTAF